MFLAAHRIATARSQVTSRQALDLLGQGGRQVATHHSPRSSVPARATATEVKITGELGRGSRWEATLLPTASRGAVRGADTSGPDACSRLTAGRLEAPVRAQRGGYLGQAVSQRDARLLPSRERTRAFPRGEAICGIGSWGVGLISVQAFLEACGSAGVEAAGSWTVGRVSVLTPADLIPQTVRDCTLRSP